MDSSPWADDWDFAGTQMNNVFADIQNFICRLVSCKVPLYPLKALNSPKGFPDYVYTFPQTISLKINVLYGT